MRIASLLSIFSLASAPAAQSKSFDSALQAAISDALQRHSGQGPADDPQSMATANAASPAPSSNTEDTPLAAQDPAPESSSANAAATDATANTAPVAPVPASGAQRQTIAAAPAPMLPVPSVTPAQGDAANQSNFAAVPVVQGNRANGTPIDASPRGAAIVGQPSQPPSISLSQGAAAASKASASAVAQQRDTPSTTINARMAIETPGGHDWSQTATTTAAQIRAIRAKGTTGGAAATRIAGPATKFSGTVQTVLATPFFHLTAVPAPQIAPSASTVQPPIVAAAPPPVAEAATPVSVPGPELHATPSLSSRVSPGLSFAANPGRDSIAPQTASSPSNDVATRGNDGRQDADSAMAATTAQAAETVANVSATPVANAGHGAAAAAGASHSATMAPVAAAPTDLDAARVTPATSNSAAQAGAASVMPVPAQFLNVLMEASPMASDLPVAPASPGGAQQTSITPAQRGASRVAASGNPYVSATGVTPHTRATGDGSGLGNTFAGGVQNTVQPAQRSHADSSQAAVAAPIAASAQIAQAVLAPSHTAAHDAGQANRPMDGASNAPRELIPRGDSASLPQAVDDAAPASGIHAASVIQAMGETEMRVGMHSAEFGDISIRTSVSAQQMTTQIAVDHSGLGQAISAHASSVQARFQEQYGVHAAIEVTQQGASFAREQGGSFAGGQREQQGFVRSAGNETAPAPDETEIGLGQLAMAAAGGNYRLDIRA